MSDLDRLIAAVEAGNIGSARDAVAAIEAALGSFYGYRDGVAMDVVGAFIGSIDAAKRLHDALLPGWIWNVVDSEATVWPDFPGDPRDHQDGYCEGNPARSWLLAILRAVKAKGAGE